jgi:hypothetical protein
MDESSNVGEGVRTPTRNVLVKESTMGNGVKKTEVSGGVWDATTKTYSIQDPIHTEISTVYTLVPSPQLKNTDLVSTASYRDGKRVVFDKSVGQWRNLNPIDEAKSIRSGIKSAGFIVSSEDNKIADKTTVDAAKAKLIIVKYKNTAQLKAMSGSFPK